MQLLVQWGLVIFVALTAALGAPASAESVPATPQLHVRVANGTTPELLSLPDDRAFSHFLPRELKGATAQITHVPGAVRAIQALLADEVDVAIATLPAGLTAVESGQDVVAFCLASGARPYLHLVAHRSIRAWSDLDGQDIAVIGPVDSTHYLAQMQLRQAGVPPERAVWRSVGGGAGRANALLSGAAKAAMLQSAQALDLVDRGPFHVLPPPGPQRNDFIFKVFWARRAFLRSHPALSEAIVRAELRAVREALSRSVFIERATVELRPLPLELLQRSYDLVRNLGVWEPDNALFNKAAGDATLAELVRLKVLRSPIDFDRWAVTDVSRRALATLSTQP